ncbi:hypothetical protein BDN72DRAFT_843419 [Pluteus cervinus]|uniref:Uncharacterized protein n=1 Tax=Pluteus cervinus TaxID=181527 RepID=A0ACD3AN88_9AGAR|nr:hypothetical protein BDN72DRAFT_843419 [Pluteus cervinus]
MSSPTTFSFNLPTELEREVFIFALQDEVTSPIALLLVAKYVYDWLIVDLYKTVLIRSFRQDISMDGIETYGHHTRHLLVEYGVDWHEQYGQHGHDVGDFISHFPNVYNIALWSLDRSGNEIQSLIELDHVTHLSLNIMDLKVDQQKDYYLRAMYTPAEDPELFEWVAELERKFAEFSRRVTHLEIPECVREAEDLHHLKYFTGLTHLCVLEHYADGVFEHVVEVCRKVEVIVFLIGPEDGDRFGEEKRFSVHLRIFELVKETDSFMEGLEDFGIEKSIREKIVPIHCRGFVAGWKRCAQGSEDMWALADGVIQERLRGRG